MAINFPDIYVRKSYFWTSLKAVISSKSLNMQFDEDNNAYTIFALDGFQPVYLYVTTIYKGTVPDGILGTYSQVQNDSDKSDFETNYKNVVNVVAVNSVPDNSANSNVKLPVLVARANTSAPTWTDGYMAPLSVDTSGALRITGSISASNPSVSTTGSAPPASATYLGGSVTTAAPTYTNGQMSGLSLTTGGLLRIDGSAVTQPISGTVGATQSGTWTVQPGNTANTTPWLTTISQGGNAATVTASNALKVDGSAVTQPVSGTVTAAQATAANLNATVVQATAANLRSQTASEFTTAAATGTVASLTGGAVTTAAPTYTTGQMNPLSLTTAGALRIDGSAVTQPVSGTVAATQSGTWTATVTQTTASNLNAQVVGPGAAAAAISGNPVRVGGSDGTNTRNILTDTAGRLLISGAAPDSSAVTGNPVLVGGQDGTNVQATRTDNIGRTIIAPTFMASTLTGLSFGQVALAVNTINAVRATAYTEPSSNAQRSISSSSALDTAAGTGARTIRITYYTSAYVGPNTVTLTLNGTANVNTGVTDICFIEKIEVLTCGSGGSNAGTITLFGATAGGGGTVGTIAVGDCTTYWSHHYIATGQTCFVTNINVANNQNQAMQFVIKHRPSTANACESPRDWVRAPISSSNGAFQRFYDPPLNFVGPGRLVLYVKPDNAVTATYFGSFDYYEQ